MPHIEVLLASLAAVFLYFRHSQSLQHNVGEEDVGADADRRSVRLKDQHC